MQITHCLALAVLAISSTKVASAAELGPVTQQDTLWSLARVARADQPYSMYQVIIALQQKNPRAFIGNNVHHVQLGAVLQLPDEAEIAAIDPVQAQQKFEADELLWQQFVRGQRASAAAGNLHATLPVTGEKPARVGLSGLATTALIQQVTAKPKPDMSQVTATATSTREHIINPATKPLSSHPASAHAQHAAKRPVPPAASSWQQQVRSDSTVSLDGRLFPQRGLQGQAKSSVSGSWLQEWYWQTTDENQSVALTPYLRWDQQDSARHLVDLRQAYWHWVGRNWELKLGLDQVFWGVTESQHLVDIINQTDLVDSIDGESKLGQPMLQWKVRGDWGNLQTFLLPYFRERTFAGMDGRLRLPLLVNQHLTQYESGAEQQHLDWAVRYAKQIDQLDIALSYFKGTSRDPLYLLNPLEQQFAAYYQQIEQWGLEGQWIVDSWIWKLEAVHRDSRLERYSALTSGFEYSSVGVFDSAVDVGFLIEYQYDSRGSAAPVPGQRDLFVGTRLAFNDADSTELLFGVAQDLQDRQTRSGMLEASTRFSNNLRLRVDMWFFQTSRQSQPSWWFRRDDYIQLGFDYYF